MRTTVEIPDELRKKLVEEAASRNLRGFSPLVVEAIRLYFSRQSRNRESTIKRLKGSLSPEQMDREWSRLKEVRENWRR